MYVLIDDKNIVMATGINQKDPLNKATFDAGYIIDAPDNTVYGDTFKNGAWQKTGNRSKPTPQELSEQYSILATQYINELYTHDDEHSLENKELENIRAGLPSSAEYKKYRKDVESCKNRAHKEVYGKDSVR